MMPCRFLVLWSLFALSTQAQENCMDPFSFSHQHFYFVRQNESQIDSSYIVSPTNKITYSETTYIKPICSDLNKILYLYDGTYHVSTLILHNTIAQSLWSNGTKWGNQPIYEPCTNSTPFTIQTDRGFANLFDDGLSSQYRIYTGNGPNTYRNLIGYVELMEDANNSVTVRARLTHSILATGVKDNSSHSWEVWNNSTLPPMALAFLIGFKVTKDLDCSGPGPEPAPQPVSWPSKYAGIIGGGAALAVAAFVGLAWYRYHNHQRSDEEARLIVHAQ